MSVRVKTSVKCNENTGQKMRGAKISKERRQWKIEKKGERKGEGTVKRQNTLYVLVQSCYLRCGLYSGLTVTA